MAKRVLRRGKKISSVAMRRVVRGMIRAGSYLKPVKARGRRVEWNETKRSLGKYFYTVESPIEPVTFTRKRDAESFKRLLKNSTAEYRSDIVRREITKEGYHVT